MNKQSLALHRLKLLLAWLTTTAAKNQLGPQLPLKGDAPFLRGPLVDDGIVVLEIGTEAFRVESEPHCVLMHSAGMLAPVSKLMRVNRKGLLELVDWSGILVKEYLCAVSVWHASCRRCLGP